MKIIIAGGRNYVLRLSHFEQIKRKINYYYCSGELIEFVSGECSVGKDIVGADVLNHIFKYMFPGTQIKRFLADWNKHGKAAGPIRNEQMAKYADGCILLPGGKGTANMKMNAVKYGLKVWEIK